MDAGAIATIVGLLGACLVALVLVLVARREAGVQRARAEHDVASIKDEAAPCWRTSSDANGG